MRDMSQLRPVQLRVAERMCNEPELMLGLAMGLGKTVTTLTAIRHLLDTFQARHFLIIAPLLVAEETWPDEIESWKHTCVLEYEVLTGPPDRREQRTRRLAEVSIINTENVGWLVEFWGDDWPYDGVVIDEISRFKNPAKRTKPTKTAIQKIIDAVMAQMPKDAKPEDIEMRVAAAVKKAPRNPTRFGYLTKVRKRIDYIYGLTGTMAPNGLLDIWSQFYLLDQGQRLGTTYGAYRSRYFESDYNGFKYTIRPGAFEQIVERIQDITISMRTEDYVDLPPVIHNVLRVYLPAKIMAKYRKFEKTLLFAEHDIEAVNNGVLTGKLLQLCIAGGTEVLCARGWVAIENVLPTDQVWDGVEYVSTKGVKYNGMSPVVSCYGVSMTRGHRVLTEKGWFTAEEILNANAREGFDRSPVWLPDGYVQGGNCHEQGVDMALPLCLRGGSGSVEHFSARSKPREAEVLRMPARGNARGGMGDSRDDWQPSVRDLAGLAPSLSKSKIQGLCKLWRKGHRHASVLVRLVHGILARRAGRLRGGPVAGSSGQQSRLQQTELSLGELQGPAAEHTGECHYRVPVGSNNHRGSRGESGFGLRNAARQDYPSRMATGKAIHPADTQEPVYDLIDCGPRNRFVVRGSDGELIVHNCNGSVYDEDGNAIEIHSLKLDALDRVIEEANGAPVMVAYSYEFDLAKLKKRYPQAEVVGEASNLQKRWNNKEISILLAHPQSAGHGLNLQYGGCIMVWYGLCWSLEYYQQLNKRLDRPGQTESVIIHHIVADGTVDDRVMEVLPEKAATQDALVAATLYVDESDN